MGEIMIDIHCHILHKIDDGPERVKESLALISLASENNIEKVILTPHLYSLTSADAFLEKRTERIQELQQQLDMKSNDVEIYAGAELYCTDDIFYENSLRKYTLNNSRYLLVEFPVDNLPEKRFIKYILEISSHGLVPVIAHPERYTYLQKNHELINYVAQLGALFQINSDSLSGYGSKAELKLSMKLLKNEMASFIASDAHSYDYRPNNILENISLFGQDVEYRVINNMLNVNPEDLLNDRTIDTSMRKPL